jgi:peptidoglycan LD-endopeptidase CwlK
MDPRLEQNLAHVQPDLVRVVRAALQTPQPFVVVYGIRTLAAEEQAVASGHSETLHSRHLPQKRYATPADPDGVSCAVDVAALIDGKVSFAPGQEEKVFGQIAEQIKAAAAAAGVKIQWGGDPIGAWVDGQVSHFRDWGHFQLDPSAYP